MRIANLLSDNIKREFPPRVKYSKRQGSCVHFANVKIGKFQTEFRYVTYVRIIYREMCALGFNEVDNDRHKERLSKKRLILCEMGRKLCVYYQRNFFMILFFVSLYLIIEAYIKYYETIDTIWVVRFCIELI